MAQGNKLITVSATGCGFKEYIILLFFRFSVKAKRGVEFHHRTPHAFRIRQKVGTGLSYIGLLLPTMLYAGYSVKLYIY